VKYQPQTKEFFMNQQEFNKQYDTYYQKEKTCELAFKVYSNALKNANNFCLLGRENQLNDIIGNKPVILTDNQIILANDSNCSSNFLITNGNQPGNVLKEDSWNPSINDAWVVGGINGRSTFNFVGDADILLDDFKKNYLQGNEKHPITVTAREICGLKEAKYRLGIINGALIFEPPEDEAITCAFDFKKYHDALNDNVLDGILKYIEQAPKQTLVRKS
jgi:hypothetical protein